MVNFLLKLGTDISIKFVVAYADLMMIGLDEQVLNGF